MTNHLTRIPITSSLPPDCGGIVLAFLTQTTGWWSGVLHPVQGLEHLTTMLLVGALAGLGTLAGRSPWRAPLTFLLGLSVGSLLAAAGVVVVPDPRWLLVVIAVALAGLLFVIDRVARPLPAITLVVGLLHGLAHAQALASSEHPVSFLAGSLFTACVAIACGGVVGLTIARSALDRRAIRVVAVAPAPVAQRRAA